MRNSSELGKSVVSELLMYSRMMTRGCFNESPCARFVDQILAVLKSYDDFEFVGFIC